ncbi:MAG TPA: TolC family protein [Rectinemataceae bacterium]|nr:TolC family protein [Rectinemataceae bacterium]
MRGWLRLRALAALGLLAAGLTAQQAAGGPSPSQQPSLVGVSTSISLNEAVRRAGTASVSVRAAASLVEAAQKRIWVAASTFFPKISASVSGAWLANPPAGVTVDKGALGTSTQYVPVPLSLGGTYDSNGWYTGGTLMPYSVSLPSSPITIVPDAKDTYFKGNLTLSQPILAWGKINAGLELARLEEQIAALGLSGSRLEAEREAKRSYDAALLARDSQPIIKELRALASANADDARDAFAAGTTTKASVLQAQAQVADLDSRLVDAGEGEKSALAGLAIIAGLGEEAFSLSSELADSAPSLDETKILEAAIASSSDRGQAKARLTEAARKLDLERGSAILLPNLAAFASLDASGQTIPFSSSGWADSTWSWDLSLGVQAQLEAFDGGASFAKIAAAKADLAAARIGVEGSEDSLRMAVRDAVSMARRAAAALASKEARAEWAAEALRSAKAALDAGMSSRPEYNAAAMAEAAARLDLVSARYTLSEALADLERLAGGKLP